MPLPPNIDALLAATQTVYADTLDIVETCTDAIITGDIDYARVHTFRQRLADAPRYALGSVVTLQAGFLAAAAVDLACHTGTTPADVIADWRQQAAAAVDLAEADLAGEST